NKALDVIGSGCVYPMLYNDDINIPSVAKAFSIKEKEAEQYVPYGCGEYTINHRSTDSPNGIINLAKALEVILHGGFDPMTGNRIGIPVDRDLIKSFDDLINIYRTQVERHLEALAWQQRLEYKIAAGISSFLYFSILYDSCIERGESLYNGGVDFLGGTMETYGNTVAADSLYAIKKAVYDEGQFSLVQLAKMLSVNFEGFEKERKLLMDLPKYGNDHDGVDTLYCNLHDHVCNYTRSLAQKNDLHHYLVVIINNDANTDLGFHTGASADGRKAGKSLNNGNSPSPGNDREGLTAFLNSIVKPRTDIHAGAVQNIKFSKDLFTKNRNEVEASLRTYFKKGGAQAMITVVGRKDLENALENPEDYRNLIVRVGGFSARFVELRKEVQLEILNRTLY
ncbi:MAG: pyruvate formate-lyase, partial [Bacteroidales bacterium]|nr:pyruvate formate-lyase [Bacteroidales bacterium]